MKLSDFETHHSSVITDKFKNLEVFSETHLQDLVRDRIDEYITSQLKNVNLTIAKIMDHGITNDFLYSACKIDCSFQDDLGNVKSISGTAFFILNTGNTISLVTNRHCIDLDYKQTDSRFKKYKLFQVLVHSKIKDPVTHLPSDSNDLLILNIQQFQIHSVYENDVAVLNHIQPVEYKKGHQERVAINYFIPRAFLADTGRINMELNVCDFVAFPGYPPWYDKKNNLPILRTGTIASDPRYSYSWTGTEEGDCVGYEAFSYGGSSGSPVFAVRKGIKIGNGLSGGNFRELMLVGINAGHLDTQGSDKQHSGISYFYKSSIILELLDAG